MKKKFVITCEHCGNNIPEEYQYIFYGVNDLLDSQRSYDLGAREFHRSLCKDLADTQFTSSISKLLIDVNRSRRNPHLFSEFSRPLNKIVKQYLVKKYYNPYRNRVYAEIYNHLEKRKQVVHLSIHTFPSDLEGDHPTDMSMVFDGKRQLEQQFAELLTKRMKNSDDRWQVSLNYPDFGRSDSLIDYFRKEFEPEQYLGFQLELNLKHFNRITHKWPRPLIQAIRKNLIKIKEKS